MAKSYVVTFAGDKVGLIVRGKKSPAHEPGVMEQHADVILPDGSPPLAGQIPPPLVTSKSPTMKVA
jgi:hypothetical protein